MKKPPFEIGTRFGDWEVIGQLEEIVQAAGVRQRIGLSRVRCALCGTERVLKNNYLRAGGSQGCGCRRGRALASARTTHSKSYAPLYRFWQGIKQRLKHQVAYAGIKIYGPWENDFTAFERFMESLGPKPTPEHTLDRIDPGGNYEPGNLRWADKKTQSENRRNNKFRQVLDKSIVKVGERHGMLTVTGLLIERRHGVTWYCANVRCDCGIEKTVYQKQLLNGRTRSCGCYRQRNVLLGRLAVEKPIEWNGRSQSLASWAREIGLSDEALWARINKYGWSLERALTEPLNKEQRIEANGESLTPHEWQKRNSIPARVIAKRIKNGWEPSRAVAEPMRLYTTKRQRELN